MSEFPRPLTEREIREWTEWTGPFAALSSIGRFLALVAAGHAPESLEIFIERVPVDPPEWVRPEDYGLSVGLGPRRVTHCGSRPSVRPRLPSLEDWLRES